LWRLRVGDYPVILEVRREGLVNVALDAGDRSNICN
jgi:mRNA-degrading endonuclease RelE of RelBE toxin-antitoxin system